MKKYFVFTVAVCLLYVPSFGQFLSDSCNIDFNIAVIGIKLEKTQISDSAYRKKESLLLRKYTELSNADVVFSELFGDTFIKESYALILNEKKYCIGHIIVIEDPFFVNLPIKEQSLDNTDLTNYVISTWAGTHSGKTNLIYKELPLISTKEFDVRGRFVRLSLYLVDDVLINNTPLIDLLLKNL